MQLEKQPTQQEQQPIEKSNQHTNLNEVRQRGYVLGAKEREILLIQQSIQTNIKGYLRKLSGIFRDTIHEGSTPYL